jgi:hypothetical protein
MMHRALESYVARVWRIAEAAGRHDLRLAATVLSKRAFSSAASLARSLERRVAGLTDIQPPEIQPVLRFEPEDDRQDEAVMESGAAFERSSDEIRTLNDLLAMARQAAASESKLRVLARLLDRAAEPAIVFTEYRDTLNTLADTLRSHRTIALLHGGLSVAERAHAVLAFTDGDVDLLLSTDAGAEGLNLHTRCRLVVNLELPWNPVRLEQRIGRVDRIGQTKTVHAVNLLANGTTESDILAVLLRRLGCIQASEIEIAASIIDRAPPPARRPDFAGSADARHADLGRRAHAEVERLRSARRDASILARPDIKEGCVAATVIRNRRFPTICFVQVRIASAAGRLVEDLLLALALPCHGVAQAGGSGRPSVRQRAEEVVRVFGDAVRERAREIGKRRAAELDRTCGQSVQEALRREHHLAQAISPALSPRYQPGLFDNRSAKARHDAQRQSSLAANECARRATSLASDASFGVATDPQILLVLVSC